jgi:hypothetical protein
VSIAEHVRSAPVGAITAAPSSTSSTLVPPLTTSSTASMPAAPVATPALAAAPAPAPAAALAPAATPAPAVSNAQFLEELRAIHAEINARKRHMDSLTAALDSLKSVSKPE